MKANRGQIEKAMEAAGRGSADVRLFFFYGPDEAGSAAIAKALDRAMGPNAERIDLDTATLRSDPARLSDEAASISMFGDRRWVRLNGIGDESLPAIEALLEAEAAGNPVVAVSGALKPTSKLVKLVLAHPRALGLISYQPDAREAEQIAIRIAREHGLRLASDLARRIVDIANGDRALMAGEIEKLMLYLDAAPDQPQEVTSLALDALAADSPESDTGAMVNAVLSGDVRAMEKELAQLSAVGTSIVSVLRPLMTRALLLAQIREAFDSDGRLDAAVESVGKAVFWKDKALITRQVRIWDSPGVARLIHRLSQAERASRSGKGTSELMVRHELLTIARAAARERA